MAIPHERKHRDQLAYIENPKNTGDVDRRVHDVCANATLESILTALGGSSGTPFTLFNKATSTPGTTQVLLATVVGASESLILKSIRVTSRRAGYYEIKLDGNVIGSGRVGAGNMNDDFIWRVDKTATTTQTVSVEFTAPSSAPASDVEITFQGLKV